MIHSTIYDVAVRAGVSVATVSRTFAKPDIVTEATRKKVIEAANELDFAISRSATALKSKHTFHIAMLTGEAIATWFDSNLYKGLTEVLQTHGYDVSLYGIADTEQRMSFFDELPLRRNVDAVIVASFNVTMEEISNLQADRRQRAAQRGVQRHRVHRQRQEHAHGHQSPACPGAPAYRLHLHRRLGGADGIQCGLAPAGIRIGLCGV